MPDCFFFGVNKVFLSSRGGFPTQTKTLLQSSHDTSEPSG